MLRNAIDLDVAISTLAVSNLTVQYVDTWVSIIKHRLYAHMESKFANIYSLAAQCAVPTCCSVADPGASNDLRRTLMRSPDVPLAFCIGPFSLRIESACANQAWVSTQLDLKLKWLCATAGFVLASVTMSVHDAPTSADDTE